MKMIAERSAVLAGLFLAISLVVIRMQDDSKTRGADDHRDGNDHNVARNSGDRAAKSARRVPSVLAPGDALRRLRSSIGADPESVPTFTEMEALARRDGESALREVHGASWAQDERSLHSALFAVFRGWSRADPVGAAEALANTPSWPSNVLNVYHLPTQIRVDDVR